MLLTACSSIPQLIDEQVLDCIGNENRNGSNEFENGEV
jgi:hypothetical protein